MYQHQFSHNQQRKESKVNKCIRLVWKDKSALEGFGKCSKLAISLIKKKLVA
jgi:hypothetical protein